MDQEVESKKPIPILTYLKKAQEFQSETAINGDKRIIQVQIISTLRHYTSSKRTNHGTTIREINKFAGFTIKAVISPNSCRLPEDRKTFEILEMFKDTEIEEDCETRWKHFLYEIDYYLKYRN